MMVCLSEADWDLTPGSVIQEQLAFFPLLIPPPPSRGGTPTEGHLPPLPDLTFLITGTANKQVTTAGVSKARWGVFKGHMPLRL